MEKNINILVSSICFINRNKSGAEIYATFANRQIDDAMTKTPYDIRVITNEPELFEENQNKWGDRVTIVYDNLENNQIAVGPFNQLLKYKTMENVPKKYDWLLYLDCDAGFIDNVNVDLIEENIQRWEEQGYDILGTRTNCTVKGELLDHERRMEKAKSEGRELIIWGEGNLFSAKFVYYGVSTENGPFEWFDAMMPSEHILLIKNNEKLSIMASEFKNFCTVFEKQMETGNIATWDMEAFEIGISAKLAGYNMGELGTYGHHDVLKVGFNSNNWEKIKL
jgi:hypothetical protein